MKLGYLIKRGANLLKLGLAARQIRKSTSEEQHQRAKKYLVELLGKSRGLPTKIGQFITMDSDDHALRESLIDSIVPMPFHEVTEILGLAYGDSSVFKKLDKEPKVASLGQVHFGTLKDGTEVAVKIQYSEIAGAVESELDIMGWLPKAGPVAKWGFKMDGYRDAFWENFSEELDYRIEIKHQTRYRKLITPLERIVIPEVIEDLCKPNILVQKKEEGFGLDKAETMMPAQKQADNYVV